MNHHFTLLFATLLGMILGCGQRAAEDTKGPTEVETSTLAKEYKNLQLITAEPVHVNPTIATLCVARNAPEMSEDAHVRFGPHAFCAIKIYMNDLAAGAFDGNVTPYPVGSVVIKEKQLDPSASEEEVKDNKDGVGGMVKRPAGFDPNHGDWEYFYFESPDDIESGRIASCIDCHAGAKQKDYVFGSWYMSKKT